MILAVDVGNTRVKTALVGSEGVTGVFTIPTAVTVAEPELFARRLQPFRARIRGIEGVAVCSVVPELEKPVVSALRHSTGLPVFIVRSTSRFPFRIRVASPARVGTDRLAAAAGALGSRGSTRIIVDVGSAVTVDIVVRGVFRGGLIMAGPDLAVRALGNYARRLPEIDLRSRGVSSVDRFDDTVPSMVLGARTGAAGAILEAVRLLRRNCGLSPRVSVTGGGAPLVEDRLPLGWARDPDLVVKGLSRLWVLNAPPSRTRRGRQGIRRAGQRGARWRWGDGGRFSGAGRRLKAICGPGQKNA